MLSQAFYGAGGQPYPMADGMARMPHQGFGGQARMMPSQAFSMAGGMSRMPMQAFPRACQSGG